MPRRIFLSGGGTAGSVTPLLAVAEHLSDSQLWFVGTVNGIERQLVKDLTYLILPAGKWRRYVDWHNVTDLFKIGFAFWKALYLCVRYRPQVVVSAGGFVAVPLIWAAWCCGIPTVVHQQDLQISLATRLTKLFATRLTKAFEHIPLKGAQYIGNPTRALPVTTNHFALDPAYPTVLIVGGGTGAQGLNALVSPALCSLANIIHGTGTQRQAPTFTHVRYYPVELFQADMAEALHKADLVICRAGLGTLSELAALGKAAIVIPMPNSHQVNNAKFFYEAGAIVLQHQADLNPATFTELIQRTIQDKLLLQRLRQDIQQLHKADAAEQLAVQIKMLCHP